MRLVGVGQERRLLGSESAGLGGGAAACVVPSLRESNGYSHGVQCHLKASVHWHVCNVL